MKYAYNKLLRQHIMKMNTKLNKNIYYTYLLMNLERIRKLQK